MNSMTCTGSAARLSEDIGDVLGAIRRLIAEDEAMDYVRENQGRQRSFASHDAPLASVRNGGAAAMARRMVADGVAAMADKPAEQRLPLIADRDRHVPRMRSAPLTAHRDVPFEHAAGAAQSQSPLRLRESDRVIGDAADWVWHDAQPVQANTLTGAHISDDDFAEAFDAKARMRPELTKVTPVPQARMVVGKHALPIENDSPDARLTRHPFSSVDGFGDIAARQEVPEAMTDNVGSCDECDDRDGAMPQVSLSIPAYVDADLTEHEVADGVPDDFRVAAHSEKSRPLMTDTQPAQVDQDMVSVSAPAGVASTGSIEELADDEEQSIRDLISEMIQEELHGELGQRFSRNLRAVIRREVAAAIDEHLERL